MKKSPRETGDLVIIFPNVWRCTGIYLGGTNQQSVFGLFPLTQHPAHEEVMVPYEFFEHPRCLILGPTHGIGDFAEVPNDL